MFHHYVLPILQQSEHSQKQILKWRIFGLAESEIAQTLEEALQNIDCQTGYRWESPYIEFKVRCNPRFADHIKAIIDPIIAPHVISTVDKKASETLCALIADINEPITIIDEATGGLLQILLTKPSLYHLLNFTGLHQNKMHFHIHGLEEYWKQLAPKGNSQLIIDYKNQHQKGQEIHCVPYRSASVIEYAAEWSCFRLLQLINQLHQ
jgi:molybdopterin-biosynthesis enzyme MoeA-like protein